MKIREMFDGSFKQMIIEKYLSTGAVKYHY